MTPAALALLGLLLPAAPATEDVARYAIIVGHNGGYDDAPSLRYADDDAARLFRLLVPSTRQAWLLTTFDAESVNLYPSLSQIARPPTKAALAQVLGEANWALNERSAEGQRTELMVFFAGHGDVDVSGQGFLVFADGRFTREDLERQVMASSRADTNHVVIDACASYFMVSRGSGESSSGAVPLSPKTLDILRRPDPALDAARARTGVLVSTSSATEVHESSSLQGGLFSHLLRSALAGAADSNEDGRVEYVEAAAFLTGASAGVRDPRARLAVYAVAPQQRPHAPLTDLRRAGTDRFLAVDADAAHVRVFDEDGAPYADLYPSGGRVMLALAGSRMFVVQMGDEEAVLVPRRAGAYAMSGLDFGPAVQARGDAGPFAGLLARPVGRPYVDGFAASSSMPAPLDGERFDVAYAEGYEPPWRFPWFWAGGSALVVAGGFAALTVAAIVGNAAAFTALDLNNRRTGAVDPNLSLAVEGFRLAALGTVVVAGAAAATGGVSLVMGVMQGSDE